jgi:hypothetical protein
MGASQKARVKGLPGIEICHSTANRTDLGQKGIDSKQVSDDLAECVCRDNGKGAHATEETQDLLGLPGEPT